jgi:hypothetical protein
MARTVVPLKQKQVDNARYSSDGGNKLFDGGGLFLWVQPDGAKWWRFKYRRPGSGKENLLAFGTYPDVSLKRARECRTEARTLLADGIDPGERRKAEKREAKAREDGSFEAVAREWYGKQAHTWVAHLASDVLRRLEGNLFPDVGGGVKPARIGRPETGVRGGWRGDFSPNCWT